MKSKSRIRPVRTYYIYHVNCDCASYQWARSSHPNYGIMRCRMCRRRLGFMSFRFEGTVRARGEYEAEQATTLRDAATL